LTYTVCSSVATVFRGNQKLDRLIRCCYLAASAPYDNWRRLFDVHPMHLLHADPSREPYRRARRRSVSRRSSGSSRPAGIQRRSEPADRGQSAGADHLIYRRSSGRSGPHTKLFCYGAVRQVRENERIACKL